MDRTDKIVDLYNLCEEKVKYFIMFSYQGKEYSFSTQMIRIKDSVKIFFYPIMLGHKFLDLKKLNTTIDLFCVRESHTPVILHNTKLELIKLDKKTYVYQLCSKTEGLKVNRRNHFRMFLGIYGEAQIGSHTYPVPVIIKDISASGIAFISNEDRDIAKYNKVHIMFKDTEMNFTLNINADIIRKDKTSEGRYLYGCYFGSEKPAVEKYVQERQRYDLRCRKMGNH